MPSGSPCLCPALQRPEPAVPDGCLGVKSGAQVKYMMRVQMLSCACQSKNSWDVSLGKMLNLSGAAYKLAVFARTRFGESPTQTQWPLPAQELTGAGVARARGGGPPCARHGREVGLCPSQESEGQDM